MSGQVQHSVVFNTQKIISWYLICIVFEGKKLSYLILSQLQAYTIQGLKFVPAFCFVFFLFRLFL